MRTAKHFLRASAWLHVRERPDAFDFSAETFFLVFFSRLFVCFFHFCFVFSFLLQERRKRRRRYRRRKPIPSTLRRQERHRYIILEHSSRVRINHHHQHERYLSVPSSKYYKKVSLQKSSKTLKLLTVKIQKFKPSGSSSIRTLALRIPDTHHKHHHPFLLLAARGEVCCLASYARTHTPHTPLRARTHALDRRHDKEVSLC